MNLHIALLTGLVFVNSLTAQTHNGIPLPSVEVLEYAPSGTLPLVNTTRTLYYYNSDSTLNLALKNAWNAASNAWVPDIQIHYSYGPDGRLTEALHEKINNGNWINFMRISYTYYPDASYLDGKHKTVERHDWNVSTSQWDLISRENFTAFDAGSGALEGSLQLHL